jgi:hypothetical protein
LPRLRRTSVKREIALIGRSLISIGKAFGRLAPLLEPVNTATPPAATIPPRRKLRISPARRAAMKLHGQYLGRLGGLTPRQRAQVKKTRDVKGVRAAIGLAKKLAKS